MGAFQPMHLFVLATAGIVLLFAGALVARLAIPIARNQTRPELARNRVTREHEEPRS